jgi:hypothetical protein
MSINQEFARWAVGFSGMDGGNLNAPIWISGIEWGGGGTPTLLPNRFCHEQDGRWIPCWNDTFRQMEPQYTTYQFDQKVAKILFYIFGNAVACNNYTDYMRRFLYTQNGHCFKLNLYPLSAQNTSPDLWDQHYYKLTGLPTKILYWAWCAENRFPFIKSLVEQYSPKVILATGSSFRRDYILAFAKPEQIFQQGQIHHLANDQLSVEEIIVHGDHTHLLITPFLGQGGIMADADLQALATIIQQFL